VSYHRWVDSAFGSDGNFTWPRKMLVVLIRGVHLDGRVCQDDLEGGDPKPPEYGLGTRSRRNLKTESRCKIRLLIEDDSAYTGMEHLVGWAKVNFQGPMDCVQNKSTCTRGRPEEFRPALQLYQYCSPAATAYPWARG
jgi:hypothetical protein